MLVVHVAGMWSLKSPRWAMLAHVQQNYYSQHKTLFCLGKITFCRPTFGHVGAMLAYVRATWSQVGTMLAYVGPT